MLNKHGGYQEPAKLDGSCGRRKGGSPVPATAEAPNSHPIPQLEALGCCRWSLQKPTSNSTDQALEAGFAPLCFNCKI